MASLITFICRQKLTGALAAVLFLLLPTSSVWADDLLQKSDGPDTQLFRTVNNAQTSFKTSVFDVTDKSVAVLVVGVPLGCIAYGLAAKDNNVLYTGLLLSASEVLTYGAKYVVKTAVKRPRPYEDLSGVHTNDLESADPYSFPSGHTAGAFALATMLAVRYPKSYVIVPAFVWAGLVGYGRVYNGLHYPSDVLGGAVLGAGSSILTYALRRTVIDVFNRVTGRAPDAESSLTVMPLPQGMAAHIHIVF
jgi:membrane-associated phospholipid phosphatase